MSFALYPSLRDRPVAADVIGVAVCKDHDVDLVGAVACSDQQL